MMTYEIGCVACGGPGLKYPGPPQSVIRIDNSNNKMTPCQSYQRALDITTADVLVMCHDDVTVHDADWLERIAYMFSGGHGENKVAVGLGGATALGNKDLYRKPFNIWNMARRGYASNQTDAETHGERFTGVRRVVVLDAFVMAVRVDWLRSRGGWPVGKLTFHCLDLWLACEAARDGKETWMVGASVTHHGGGSSTKPEYRNAPWLFGGSMEMDHQAPHLWLAHEFADVLPLEVK